MRTRMQSLCGFSTSIRKEWADMDLRIGGRLVMKKNHPCGCNTFGVTRIGADIKIKCSGCGRIVMLDRGDFIKAAKRFSEDASDK